MRVVHDDGSEERTLASTVEMASTTLQQMRGLMFRRSVPDDYALVFEADAPGFPLSLLTRSRTTMDAHMLFVAMPIDVIWVDDETVTQVKTLSPWTGSGIATADTMIELPEGAADGVEAGDRVVVTE